MGQELVDALEATINATAEVCTGLGAADWDRPTGCPGWSVRDALAHLVGLETAIVTGEEPDHELPADLPHVNSPMAEYMERHVDARRSAPPSDVLAEFRQMFAKRIAALRALPDAAFDQPARGPMGSEWSLNSMLAIRVFDLWAHEQDIRRAVNRRGGLDSEAARISLDQCKRFAGPVVASVMPDASTLVWHLDGPFGGDVAWSFDDGKAATVEPPSEPTLSLTADTETFATLCCGRADARPHDVRVEGDADLATRVLADLGFTP
jgi:uncharacterized protein (TIGR03083 family)